MKLSLLGLLAFVPSSEGLKFDLPMEYEPCTPGEPTLHGFECFDSGNGVYKGREKDDNRNQCCLPRGTYECEEGECCPGTYCKPFQLSTRCVPGPDPKGLYNGLCPKGTEIEKDYAEKHCAPLFNVCNFNSDGQGGDDCCEGYKCSYQGRSSAFPAKCILDKSISKACCKPSGTKNCSPGECCVGTYCLMTSAGWTQCRNGFDFLGEYDGKCDKSDRDDHCLAYKKSCSVNNDQCCDGFTCVQDHDGAKCEPDVKARTHCAMQNFQFGCDTGDCQKGFHCSRPDTKKAQCQPGPEADHEHNGMCPPGEKIDPNEYKDVCGFPENECDLEGGADGSQGNCCEGFVCKNMGHKNINMCVEDPNLDDQCCARNGEKGCSIGDCCPGTHCVENEWDSYCRPGLEKTDVHDGLCDNNEALLECRGTVAEIWGDPHIETYNGFRYNCMGRGEFVVTRSEDTYFEVQGRFEPLKDSRYRKYTSTQAYVVAASVDDEFPKIQVNFANRFVPKSDQFMLSSCPAQLVIDGVVQDIDNIQLPGSPDVTVKKTEWSIEIQYGKSKSYAAVEIRATGSLDFEYGCMLNAFVCLPHADEGFNSQVLGLLGTPNKSKHDDWMDIYGKHVPISYDEEVQHEYCTSNWCIRDEQISLFSYGNGMRDSFNKYEHCADNYAGPVLTEEVPDHIRERCDNDIICMQEWVVGGDELMDETIRNEQRIDDIKDPPLIGNAPTTETDAPTDEEVKICPDDVKLIAILGDTPVARPPLRVVKQEDNSVTVKLVYPFANAENDETVIDYIYHQYVKGDDVCELNADVEESWSTEFTVDCWETTPIAVVRVFVADSTQVLPTDNATVAECCHQPDDDELPVVEYVYEVACTPQCPE